MKTSTSQKTSKGHGKRIGTSLGAVAFAGMLMMGAAGGANAAVAPATTITSVSAVTSASAVSASFNTGVVVANSKSSDQAHKNLTITVRNEISGNTYETTGGGSIKGSALLTKGTGGAYDLDQAAFSQLNAKGKSALANDIVKASDSAVSTGEKTGVTKETQVGWLQDLQKNPGFGSKILSQTMEQVGPDFVTANRIFAPIAPLLSTIMGLGAILIMAFLGIHIVIDLAYITLPVARLALGDSDGGGNGGGGGKNIGGKLVTSEAKHAVQEAEQNGKSGLGKYFKARIFSLVILGLCLVYLVQGQIYVMIGWILDAVGGFLGF